MALALTRQAPPVYEKPRVIARGQESRMPWVWDSLCFAVPMHQASVEGMRDLVSNVRPATVHAAGWERDNHGSPVAWLDANSGSYVTYDDHPKHDRPSTELTVCLRVKPDVTFFSWDDGGFIVNRFDVWDDPPPSPHSSWGMHRNGPDTGRMYATVAVGGTQYTLANTAAVLPTTEYLSMFLRWRSGAPPRLDVLSERGVVLTSVVYGSNVTGSIGYAAGEGIWLNGHGTSPNSSGRYSQALVWSRRLGDAEMFSLAGDPYGWYSPRRETVVVTGTYLGTALPVINGPSFATPTP